MYVDACIDGIFLPLVVLGRIANCFWGARRGNTVVVTPRIACHAVLCFWTPKTREYARLVAGAGRVVALWLLNTDALFVPGGGRV